MLRIRPHVQGRRAALPGRRDHLKRIDVAEILQPGDPVIAHHRITARGSPHLASLVTSVVVAISVLLAVAFQLNPITEFYTWFAAATTVGFVVLLIATSVAVLVFFARDRRDYSLWRVRIAPALGLIGLTVTLVLILNNLDGLAGSNALGWGIVGLLAVAFVLGVFVGTRTGKPAKAARS